jgi:hypothetical protein
MHTVFCTTIDNIADAEVRVSKIKMPLLSAKLIVIGVESFELQLILII